MKVSNRCHRCYASIRVSIMSKLNTDILCMACKDDEKCLPSYEAGDIAEIEAVRRGDYNFPGVGLTAEDQKFLAARRAARASSSPNEKDPNQPG